MKWIAFSACVLALAGLGCGAKEVSSAPDSGAAIASAPTFWKDAKPLFDQHCIACHTAGGIAPFALTDYASASAMAGAIASDTLLRKMPPWPPGADCGAFRNDCSLSSAEISLLQAWSAAGAPEGEQTDYVAPVEPDAGSLGAPDLVVDPGVSYTSSTLGTDDYHCFVFDPQLTAERDVVAFNVTPGNASIVHHVILYEVEARDLAKLQTLDDGEPGPGYTCFGGAGVDSANWIALWAPGGTATRFPAGTGVPLHPGSKLVMQVHYNLLNGRGQSDQSKVDLYLSPTPIATPAQVLPLAYPLFEIPANQKSYVVSASHAVAPSEAARVWGVGGHMHLLGTAFRLSVDRSGGGNTCLLDLPEWNFHWQGLYFLKAPIAVNAADTLRMKCVYDNSQAHQPWINGVQQISRDVGWGDSTLDEMCLGLLYVTH